MAAPIICRIAEALPVAAEAAKEVLQINPAWVNAPYEIEIIMCAEASRLGPLVAKTIANRSPWTDVV